MPVMLGVMRSHYDELIQIIEESEEDEDCKLPRIFIFIDEH